MDGSQGKLIEIPPIERRLGPIEQAVVDGDDVEAITQVLIKCARLMDESNSGRDVKALAITVMDGIMKRHELSGTGTPGEEDLSPLDRIRSAYEARGA